MELEPRMQKIELTQTLLSNELTQMNKTLSKIEISLEKQNEIQSDIRTVSHRLESYIETDNIKFQNHIDAHEDNMKRQNERIEAIEKNIQKVVWMVVSAVLMAVLGLVLKTSIIGA